MVAKLDLLAEEDLAPISINNLVSQISQPAPVDKTASVIDSLTQQILGQKTTDKWTGQGYGSAEANAKAMAKLLADAGITDIKQFGKITKTGLQEDVSPDGRGGFVDQRGNPVDPSQVSTYTYNGEMGESTYFTAPVGTQEVYGNKDTGQEINRGSGRWETQGGADLFSGTGEGEGNTGFRVQFSPDGTPVFYTTQGSSSDLPSLMPIIQLGLAATGAGGLLGNALLGAGSSQLASSVLGNAILGGATTGLVGGDILKGALTAGAAAGLAPATELVLGKIPDFNELSNPVKAAVTNAVSGTIMNKGEITPAVLVSALSAGLGAAGKDAELAKFESQMTESGLSGQTAITEEDMRKAGLVSDANLPSGTQVAGPMTLNVGGVPIYAESAGASAIKPPAGYELLSSSQADAKPAGSYYDTSINAWLKPTNEFANMSKLDQILADMETFKSGVGTMDENVIKNIVDDSLSKLPTGITLDDVTRVLSSQNYAKPEDIQTAINSINIPQGLTNQDVQSIVSTALANNPSLTTDQVSQIVNNAVSNIPSGLTAEDVTKIISGQNFATPEDIKSAISNINIPQGLSSTDVESIVSNAFANNPSLTTTDVQTIVNNAVSNIPAGLTASDVTNIIGNQDLASTSQLTQQGKDLMAALQQQGVDYNTALNDALKAQSTGFSTSINDVINQIGNVQTGLESQISGVQTGLESKIAGVQSGLESQLNAQGKALMDSLQQQGLDYNTALNEALASQASQFQNQLTGIQTGFESQLDAQGNQYLEALQARGVDYQTALEEAIAQQNAKIGEVQTGFEQKLAESTASTSADLAKLMSTLGLMGTTLSAIQAANTPKTYTYDLADPSTWGGPVYNKTTGPVAPIQPLDFGNKKMLRGTQWEKFLSPTYGQIPAQAQFNQPTNIGYNDLTRILGGGRDTLPSQALSINDVISGIQNQYGQAPKGSMG